MIIGTQKKKKNKMKKVSQLNRLMTSLKTNQALKKQKEAVEGWIQQDPLSSSMDNPSRTLLIMIIWKK